MEIRNNGVRFYNYNSWEDVKNASYDYKRKGINQHIFSKIIVKSNNYILQSILKFFEGSMIFLMSYIDQLKHFKNYHRYNR